MTPEIEYLRQAESRMITQIIWLRRQLRAIVDSPADADALRAMARALLEEMEDKG